MSEQKVYAMESQYDKIQERLKFLAAGQAMLVSARKVNGGKILIEVAQRVKETINAVSLLNQSDSRFQNSLRARRGWFAVEPKDLKNLMSVDLTKIEPEMITTSKGEEREVYPIGILDPKLKINGQEYLLKIQITETLDIRVAYPNESSLEWAQSNMDSAVKQDGQGNVLLVKGQPIYTKVDLLAGVEPNHKFIQHDERVPLTEVFDITFEDEEVETEEVETETEEDVTVS